MTCWGRSLTPGGQSLAAHNLHRWFPAKLHRLDLGCSWQVSLSDWGWFKQTLDIQRHFDRLAQISHFLVSSKTVFLWSPLSHVEVHEGVFNSWAQVGFWSLWVTIIAVLIVTKKTLHAYMDRIWARTWARNGDATVTGKSSKWAQFSCSKEQGWLNLASVSLHHTVDGAH